MPARVQRLLRCTARAGRMLRFVAGPIGCRNCHSLLRTHLAGGATRPSIRCRTAWPRTSSCSVIASWWHRCWTRAQRAASLRQVDKLTDRADGTPRHVERGLRLGRWCPRCAAALCGCRAGSTSREVVRQHSTRRDQHCVRMTSCPVGGLEPRDMRGCDVRAPDCQVESACDTAAMTARSASLTRCPPRPRKSPSRAASATARAMPRMNSR